MKNTSFSSRITLNSFGLDQNATLKAKKLMQGIMGVCFGAVLVLLLLSGVFLNKNATMGYELQTVRAERYNLQGALEQLEIEIANEGTLFSFWMDENVQAMVPADAAVFIAMDKEVNVALVD